jgi:hypothetical protein
MHDEKEIEREIYPSWKRFYSWVNSCDNRRDPYSRVCQDTLVMGLNGCASGADDLYIIEVYAI